MKKINAGIIGVTGYSGQELLRILLRHPAVSVRYLGSSRLKKPEPVGDLLPSFRGVGSLRVRPLKIADAVKACDVIFLATPHGIAMTLAPQLLRKRGLRVIDLSGDFRFSTGGEFAKAYGFKHTAPSLLREAVYGLSEWRRPAIHNSRLIANPGCYPTATLLGLAPLAKAGLLAGKGLIVDAKSGITGAGRSAKEELLYSEINEDLQAYKVNKHQHMPEIEQELGKLAGKKIRISFVPHLVPMDRGIYATIYAPLTKRLSDKQLRALYEKAYRKELFVRVLPEGSWPQVKTVSGSNLCEIGLRADPENRRAIILVAIDNLGKGAAGQAVQNMNLSYGLDETLGLR